MYCTSCGTALTYLQHFCAGCGTKVSCAVEANTNDRLFLAGDVTAPGRELHRRFISLGNMTGKTADEIVSVVGPPSSMSSMAFGRILLQWQETGCHLAILFDRDGRFIEISHQYAQYSAAPTINIGNIVIGLTVGFAAIALVFLLILFISRQASNVRARFSRFPSSAKQQ